MTAPIAEVTTTYTFTPEQVKQIMANWVKDNYQLEVTSNDVVIGVGVRYEGFGMNEHAIHEFQNITVTHKAKP